MMSPSARYDFEPDFDENQAALSQKIKVSGGAGFRATETGRAPLIGPFAVEA